MQKLSTPLAIIVAGIIIAVSNLYINGKLNLPSFKNPSQVSETEVPPTATPPGISPKASSVNIPLGGSPVLGKAEAPVVVVEFSDYQCPFCAAEFGVKNDVSEKYLKVQDPIWQPINPNLKKEYIDTGLVKFVYKDFAFLGPESDAAANAALCAGDQGKYWDYHDTLFTNQKGENQNAFSGANLKSFAQNLGLDLEKFNECLDQKRHQGEIESTTNELRVYSSQLGIDRVGTPTYFVNGKIINGGAVPYSVLKAAIESELNKLKVKN